LQLFVRAHTTDGSSKSILVDEAMRVAEVIQMLITKNHVTLSVKWSLVEQLPDLYMGQSLSHCTSSHKGWVHAFI
jgi:amyloid beta A4 precursor protein-binding family B protein 1-interacting protein